MGVNLVPIVRNFSIETVSPTDPDYAHSLQNGCITCSILLDIEAHSLNVFGDDPFRQRSSLY